MRNRSTLATMVAVTAAAAALSQGCGYNSGFIRDSTTTHAIRYQLTPQSMQLSRTVRAPGMSTGALLCFIPTDSEPIYAKAMEALYKTAQLAPNEVLLNLREDWTTRAYIFWCARTLTLSGDVFAIGGGALAMPVAPEPSAPAHADAPPAPPDAAGPPPPPPPGAKPTPLPGKCQQLAQQICACDGPPRHVVENACRVAVALQHRLGDNCFHSVMRVRRDLRCVGDR